MIRLTINGRDEELEREVALPAFLHARDINPRLVAVARNGEVIERGAWDTVTLQAGDVIEIVRMVGGG